MKSAIYIEVKGKTNGRLNGELYPWVGYFYDQEADPSEFEFVKDSQDQWDRPIKVYRAKEPTHLETPGGVVKSDLVVLF